MSQLRAALRRTLGVWTIALVAACAGPVPAPTTGPTAPTSGPTAGPATPKPTPTERAVAPDFTTWGDWLAEAPPISGVTAAPGLIQLSIDWEDGKELWLQTDDGQVLQSTSLAAIDGEIRLRSDGTNAHCERNSQGRYGWSRSSDGLFLTLTLIEDACAARAAAFARTWVHSHGAVNDGGLGVNYGVTPMIQMTLPRDSGQRWGMSGGQVASPELKTFGNDPFRAFVVVQNPGGWLEPCGEATKVDIESTTAAFVRFVKKFPGATVTTATTAVGGRPAVRLDVAVATDTCTPEGFKAFHPEDRDDTMEWIWYPGERQPLYIVQMDPSRTFLIWYQGPAAEEESVIRSISFIDRLPTP